jgi:3-oxoacyl-[acyl-carrier protein] reductase
MKDKNTENGAYPHAIVTGGSRGIGRAIVKRLANENFYVHFTYRTSQSYGLDLEQEFYGQCKGYCVDSSNSTAVIELVHQIERISPISLLVNNAAITTKNVAIDQFDWHDYKTVMDVNVGGIFNLCKAVIPGMRKVGKGDIINISSLSSFNIRKGNILSGASKAAVNRFSLGLAYECAPFNIAVNVVAPGYVETENKPFLEKNRRVTLENIPIHRITAKEEIADAIMMLVSRQPLLIGTIIPVGGGVHLNYKHSIS